MSRGQCLVILDTTIEEAPKCARALSNGDEQLWALALVETGSRGSRGFVWLSGMDCNDAPSTPREWQRRRQTQERYLMAKRGNGAAPVLPIGMRVQPRLERIALTCVREGSAASV